MNSEKILELLRKELIAWKPLDQNNIGFSENNILDIQGTVPPDTSFDYVYISPPIKQQTGVTTAAHKVQRSTETYVIDVYARRLGAGNAGKISTKKALYETSEFICNLMVANGYIVSIPTTDLNYGNSPTGRQIISVTKTFITI